MGTDVFFTLGAAAAVAGALSNAGIGIARITHRGRRPVRILAASLVLFAAVAALGYEQLSHNQLLPGTRIGGVVVGARSVDDATSFLANRLIRPMRTNPITLTAYGVRERATAWSMGLRIGVGEAVRSTLARQQSIGMFARMWKRAFGDHRNVLIRPNVDEDQLSTFVGDARLRIDRPPRDATAVIENGNIKIQRHVVGRRVDLGAAQSSIVQALRAGQTTVRLPVHLTQPAVRSDAFRKVVFVKTGENRLYLYLDRKLAKIYPVATGTPGYPTPTGNFRIIGKRRNPSWSNPYAAWSMDMPDYIPPGPGNPLGTRALYLSIGGIRIHGTPQAHTIGRPASHGCIRMLMSDAEELFERVDVGTPVVIVR